MNQLRTRSKWLCIPTRGSSGRIMYHVEEGMLYYLAS